MNLRPSGYEPDELPDCSTPRHGPVPERVRQPAGPAPGKKRVRPSKSGSLQPPVFAGRFSLAGFRWPVFAGRRRRAGPVFARPGSDLLSHALRRSTIGAEGLHGRVRDGIGCFPLAITTRPCKHRTAAQGKPGRAAGIPYECVRVRSPRKRQTESRRDRAMSRAGSARPIRDRSGPVAGHRMERRSAALPALVRRSGSTAVKGPRRFPLHVRFSAPTGRRPEKEQADRAISTG